MFYALTKALTPLGLPPWAIFDFHPLQLAAYLEALWEARRAKAPPNEPPRIFDAALGKGAREALLNLADSPLTVDGYPAIDIGYQQGPPPVPFFQTVVENLVSLGPNPKQPYDPIWHHLIYAYLVENTRCYEVFEQVLHEAVEGESLGILSDESRRWVRATEALFFSPTSPLVASITSGIRPDDRAVRRNAYYRMFGMDLNHGKDGSPTYPFVKAAASNGEFVSIFEGLLREVWRGYINVSNSSGPKTTDDASISDHAKQLHQMMSDRREPNGIDMGREEFVAVATMSWFHVTLASDTPIVSDLQCRAAYADERLRRIGQRVKKDVHSKARSLFELSWRTSLLLRHIETGAYDQPANAQLLYNPGIAGTIVADVVEIINHWSIATGHDIKAMPVTQGGPLSISGPAAPLPLPASPSAAPQPTN